MSTNINVNKNIYNSDGTVNSNRTVDLDGKTVNFDDGKVGINKTPTVPLHVQGTAIPSTSETIARFEVSDDATAYAAIQNVSTVDGEFIPGVTGRQSSTTSQSALFVSGFVDSTQDSGTTPITVFRSALANLTAAVTRPVFQWRNWTTNLMTVLANGNVGIGTTTPGEKLEVNGKTKTTTFQMTTSPTAGYVLTSDASGNGAWASPPVSSGKFGIADSNGAYTYYSTFTLAMTAATSGQTIEMFADVTESGAVTITLKNGVNINGNGHTYTLTTNSQLAFTLSNSISTTANIINLNVTCTGTSSSCLYLATNTSGTLTLTGSVFRNTSSGTCISNYANSDVEIIDFNGFSNTGGCVSWNSSPGGRLRNSYAYSSGSTAISGPSRIENCIGVSGSSYGISAQNVVTDSIGVSSGAAGIYQSAAGGVVNNCKGFSSASVGIYAIYSNLFSCFGYSTASYGIQFDNEPCRGYNCFGYSTANAGIRIVRFGSGADLEIYNSTAISTAGTAFQWEGYATNMTCVSQYNNAAGHAASGSANAIISNSSLTVKNASANCLYASGAITQKYAGCSFKGATTSVNANITQGMINTDDAYGNITI